MEEQLIGNKGFFRNFLTASVLDTIIRHGSLVTCLNLGCSSEQNTYYEFVDAFHKLYMETSLSTNNKDLLVELEEAFYGDDEMDMFWDYEETEDFREKAWMFANLFKEYLVEMKASGLYNPEISMKSSESEDIWRDSVA